MTELPAPLAALLTETWEYKSHAKEPALRHDPATIVATLEAIADSLAHTRAYYKCREWASLVEAEAARRSNQT